MAVFASHLIENYGLFQPAAAVLLFPSKKYVCCGSVAHAKFPFSTSIIGILENEELCEMMREKSMDHKLH